MEARDTGAVAEANPNGESTMAGEDATTLSASDSEPKGRTAGAMQWRGRPSIDGEPPIIISDQVRVNHGDLHVAADGGARGGIPSPNREHRAVRRRFRLLEHVSPLFASRRRSRRPGRPGGRPSSPPKRIQLSSFVEHESSRDPPHPSRSRPR